MSSFVLTERMMLSVRYGRVDPGFNSTEDDLVLRCGRRCAPVTTSRDSARSRWKHRARVGIESSLRTAEERTKGVERLADIAGESPRVIHALATFGSVRAELSQRID